MLCVTKIALLLFNTSKTVPTRNCLIHFAVFNARSVSNKLTELHLMLYTGGFDVILITESWLHPAMSNGLLDPDFKYNIYRRDRSVSVGGGVCVFVIKSLSVSPVKVESKFDELELFCFDLVDAKRCSPTRVYVVYRPPSYNEHATVYMQLLIDCFKTYYKNSYVNIIAGDLNLPKIDWLQLKCCNDIIHQMFLEFVIEFGLTQVINFPTRGNNFLDIVLIDDLQRLSSVSRHPPFSTSDHDVIQLSLLFLLDVASPDWSHDRYLWHDADFCRLHDLLLNVNWLQIIVTYPSAVGMWSAFIQILRNAIDASVPMRKCLANSSSSNGRMIRHHPKHVRKVPAFILVPSVLGGKVSQLGGLGRFEPKEHRRRKDRTTFVLGVLGGGIPIPIPR